jgi:hypothetical protein
MPLRAQRQYPGLTSTSSQACTVSEPTVEELPPHRGRRCGVSEYPFGVSRGEVLDAAS